ncbi:RNA-binding protein [Geomicrobium sediminis]|uniref:RNA-binding protein YlmH n=1 Tax=Geomicrobium sediminis TaxID=1347788 RepID=A0ABS2PAS4_9BACL|nr:YlmH/Sll1252 family protein [Geomicrobium sediminis]MBM7632510.1 RNA-binding protein YlmH [Geomicrobium sediminis]
MDIFQHFRKEEHEWIVQVQDIKDAVETTYEAKLTGFLNPREVDIVQSVIGADETVKVAFFGGVEGVERKRALIYPFFEEVSPERYNIVMFHGAFDPKFSTVSHRDLLGALMALGVKREMFGDIHVFQGKVQWFATEEMQDFILMNLEGAGKTPLRLSTLPLHNAYDITDEWEEKTGFISSLRLDTAISEMYNLSRTKAKAYIENSRVKVNWRTVEDPSFQIQTGDTLSLQKHGRRKLFSIDSETKKGNLRVTYGLKK